MITREPRRPLLRRLLVGTLCALAFTTSCDHPDRLETYPVSGTITYADGQRFSGGSESFIVFESIEHNVNATGVVTNDGTFRLGTYEPDDGAVAGDHRVSITPPTPVGDPDQMRSTPQMSPKYRNLDTSGLQVTVEPNGSNEIPITITPAR